MKNRFSSRRCGVALSVAAAFASVVWLSGCKETEVPKPLPKGMVDTPAAAEAPAEEVASGNSLLKAKARYVVGEVDLQKNQKDWKKLQIGGKIVENDKVRTGVESEADISVADGSVLKIIENTSVLFSVDSADGAKKLVVIDIGKGKVHFDIQKQKNQQYKFKTGTATAAIRGTAGFVGSVNGKMVASLKEGKVEVTTAQGKTENIVQNQTVLVDDEGKTKLLKLKSSGTEALSNVIDSVTQALDGKPVDNAAIESSLKKFDADYAAAQKSFEKTLQFRATPIGDTLFVPSVTLTARATPGILVTVWGETDTVPSNGIYQKTFAWDDSAYGTKRFLASCGNGRVELPCFMWVAEYAAMSAVTEAPEATSEEAKPAATAPKAEPKAESKNLKLSVKVSGGRSERVHLDLPATELSTNLKFSLSGITADDLDQLKSITVLRNGKPFKTIDASDLTSLSYEVPVSIARNKIADFEVVATLKNGKNFRAKKTYEVYCLVTNHPGGKARNSIVPPDQEYERLKQSGGISHE